MKFKCKSTGLVYSFEFEVDILSMQKHPDYEEVSDNDEDTKPVKTTSKKQKVTQDETSIDG